MDDSRLDRLARFADAPRTRRSAAVLLSAVAAPPLLGSIPVDARKKKKKFTLCLDGQTIKASKKNKKKLLKQGATPGACAARCVPGVWAYKSTFSEFGTGPDAVRNPAGIAVTPDGLTAWVADNDLDRITVWTRASASNATWTHQSTFGTTGSGPSNLDQPAGIAVSPDGLTIWIADAMNLRVSVWTRPGVSGAWTNQTTFGGNIGVFAYPYDVAVTPDGLTVAVADTQNSRVSVWTRPSASSTAWTNHSNFGMQGNGPTNFGQPQYVALSADGLTVLVSDVTRYRVSVWTRSTGSSNAWTNTLTFAAADSPSSNLGPPYALTSSPNGQAAWVAAGTSPIRVWSTTCPI